MKGIRGFRLSGHGKVGPGGRHNSQNSEGPNANNVSTGTATRHVAAVGASTARVPSKPAAHAIARPPSTNAMIGNVSRPTNREIVAEIATTAPPLRRGADVDLMPSQQIAGSRLKCGKNLRYCSFQPFRLGTTSTIIMPTAAGMAQTAKLATFESPAAIKAPPATIAIAAPVRPTARIVPRAVPLILSG